MWKSVSVRERQPPSGAGVIIRAEGRAAASPRAGGARPASGLTIGALVLELAGILGSPAAEETRREAHDIVAALADVPRLWPVMHDGDPADRELVARARTAAERRRRGMPLAYAVGRAAFRYLTLDVDERVLIPRPETEVLVDLVLSATGGGAGLAIDVGTGSGAIALALATEGRFERIVGTDISADALVVAAANARRVAGPGTAPTEFLLGAYLAPVGGLTARAIVSNPPYISYAEASSLPSSVRAWEPPVALLAGDGGLAPTAAIVEQSVAILEPGGVLALEVDSRRASDCAALLARDARYAGVMVRQDMTGRDRFVTATRSNRS
jgi:release factor glutamine methyltransferase